MYCNIPLIYCFLFCFVFYIQCRDSRILKEIYGTSWYIECSTCQKKKRFGEKGKREYKYKKFTSRLNPYIVPWFASP